MADGQRISAKPLSITQRKIVKAKVEAELADISQAQAAQKVFPNQTPSAASVTMSRELKKANVQSALQVALEKHGISVDSVIGVVGNAMSADRTVILGNGDEAFVDVVPDHHVRLKAAGMAAGFMGLNKNDGQGPSIHFHNHQAEQKETYDL